MSNTQKTEAIFDRDIILTARVCSKIEIMHIKNKANPLE